MLQDHQAQLDAACLGAWLFLVLDFCPHVFPPSAQISLFPPAAESSGGAGPGPGSLGWSVTSAKRGPLLSTMSIGNRVHAGGVCLWRALCVTLCTTSVQFCPCLLTTTAQYHSLHDVLVKCPLYKCEIHQHADSSAYYVSSPLAY